MKLAEKLASEPGRALYKLRQQTVEPVFGIIKAVLGFTAVSACRTTSPRPRLPRATLPSRLARSQGDADPATGRDRAARADAGVAADPTGGLLGGEGGRRRGKRDAGGADGEEGPQPD